MLNVTFVTVSSIDLVLFKTSSVQAITTHAVCFAHNLYCMNQALFDVAVDRPAININQSGGIGYSQQPDIFLAQRTPNRWFNKLRHTTYPRPSLTFSDPRSQSLLQAVRSDRIRDSQQRLLCAESITKPSRGQLIVASVYTQISAVRSNNNLVG